MGLKPNSQKRRTQSRHRREKNSHPKNIHPFIILILTPSRSSQNLSRTSSISSPVRQACPLSKFILREIAGVNAHTNKHTHTHTHTGGEKGSRGILGGFRCARKSAPLLKGSLPVLSMPKRRPSRTNVVE